jgi:hypothetical protein
MNPAQLQQAGTENRQQQICANLAKDRYDKNGKQDDQEQHRAAYPRTGIGSKHGPALTQPVEAGTHIDFPAFAGKRRGRQRELHIFFIHTGMLTGEFCRGKAELLQQAPEMVGILDCDHFPERVDDGELRAVTARSARLPHGAAPARPVPRHQQSDVRWYSLKPAPAVATSAHQSLATIAKIEKQGILTGKVEVEHARQLRP